MSDFTLDHVVIAVRDLASATADYTALLGREPSWRGEHPKYGTANTLFRIDNTYIELIALAGGKQKSTPWTKNLARFLERGEGLSMLALGTSDVKAAVRDLRNNGMEIADPADGEGVDLITGARRAWRNAMAAPKTTNGVQLLFIEHRSPPDALPVAAPIAEAGAFVKRMDHAVVLSADMEASRRVWGDIVGARLALDRTFPERNTRILFFRLADITIEISGGAVQSKEGVGKPDRMWGIAWGVDSIEATCARLAAAGIETSGPRPGIKPGTIIATVKGPHAHGVATLLIEHTPESFRPESRDPHGQAFDNAPHARAFNALGLDHVVIATADIDAAAATWTSTLGLAVTDTGVIEARASRPGFKMSKLPAGNAFVELIAPLETPPAGDAAAANAAPPALGMFSISVEVDDLEAAVRDLRAKGVLVSDPAPGAWPNTRTAQVNRQAANGVPIQLLQRA
jgi:catechol 2,3-dioxygenase-like lactoylglutathione lyase family enzyme